MALVAGSVAGLEPENITVLDTLGTSLSKSVIDKYGDSNLSVNEMNYKREYESDLEQRLQSMLERVVGLQKVVVRVAAELDFSKVEKTEELFDPDQVAVRSEQRRTENSSSQSAGTAGVPGVVSNVPGRGVTPETAREGGNRANKTDETRNYEISKLVSHTVMPVGAVKKISVAVLVDGYHEPEGGENAGQYRARSSEDLDIYANMVKKAIGFDKKRGDQVEVANVPFDYSSLEREVIEMKSADRYAKLYTGLKYLAIILMALFFYFKILRPLLKVMFEGVAGTAAGKFERRGEEGPEKMAEQVTEKVEIGAESVTVMDQVTAFADENPDEVAKVVKMWLKGRNTA